MSFRLRAFALVMFLAVTATGATAWLTLRQASRQVVRSVAAEQRQVEQITGRLRAYAHGHATWSGVAPVVRALAAETGQRVRVVTPTGSVVADSDELAGRDARAVVGAPVVVDPRPAPHFPEVAPPLKLAGLAAHVAQRYRDAAAVAACLLRAGAKITVSTEQDGIPWYAAAPGSSSGRGCARVTAPQLPAADLAAAARCADEPPSAAVACARAAFQRAVEPVAPQPVHVYLGAADDPGVRLAVAPAAAVASGVAAAAMLVALVLSRRVLRPVDALIRASRDVGAGELSRRVPVAGRDEIAELGRTFNRMAASLQESEERQRRLIGDVAHELRTPLANVRGYLEAVRDGVVAPDRELIDSLHEEVLLQQRIVEDLHDLALAEAGQLTYHRRALDVGDLLAACAAAHQAVAATARVALEVDPAPPAHVYADPDRLRQVLGNLVTNALRATPPGGSVRLSWRHDGEWTRIAVTDTGSGIPAADLPHVFERLWRADSARGRATGGSGLGLAIARQIVTDHAGTIDVTSTPGTGTTFTVALPTG